MKSYYGNYLGLVVSGGNKDPEGRGRCQVFIPNIMPALYEEWNKEGTDIQFDIIGDGLPGALSPNVIERLKKTLPWAECAAPITGTSPSTYVDSFGTADEVRRNNGSSAAALANLEDVYGGTAEENAAFRRLTSEAAQNTAAVNKCGTAVGNILEDVFKYTNKQVRDGARTSDVPLNFRGARHGTNYTSILGNLGWTPVKINAPEDAPPNSILTYKAVPGNKSAAGRQYGHVEYVGINASGKKAYYYGLGGPSGASRPAGGCLPGFTGVAWVPPKDVTDKALARLGQSPLNASSLSWPTADANMKPDPTKETGQYESGAGSQALAKDRQQRFGQEIAGNQEQILNRIQALANREVGSNQAAQQAFIETIVNRAYFSNRSINTIIYEGAYGFKGTDTAPSSPTLRNAFQSVINGSNITNLATDAGYNLPGAGPGRSNFVTGNKAKQVTGVMDLQTGQLVTDQALLNKLNTEGDRSGRYEYFVRQDRATTRAGIESYAQERGIEQGTAIAQGAISQPTIQNPTEFSGTTGHPTNYQANGMFGYASEGTAVWCFFREGNPLFPVYFAASFGQREWQNHYQYSSPGIGAGEGGATPGTEASVMNSYGGGFKSVQATDESGLEPQSVFQLFGKNGSNVTFLKDHTEINSMYDLNIRTLGDSHDVTHANKETRVQGDYNTYAEQDVYITVGNWSEEAIAASNEIQQYLNEAMEIKSKAGSSTAGGASTYNPTKSNVQLSQEREAAQRQVKASVRQTTASNNTVQRLNSTISRGDKGNIKRITDQYT